MNVALLLLTATYWGLMAVRCLQVPVPHQRRVSASSWRQNGERGSGDCMHRCDVDRYVSELAPPSPGVLTGHTGQAGLEESRSVHRFPIWPPETDRHPAVPENQVSAAKARWQRCSLRGHIRERGEHVHIALSADGRSPFNMSLSVVCGKDAVPRASINNLSRLMDEMVTALARCRHALA